jgi:uncharacterized protein (DUF362 family)
MNKLLRDVQIQSLVWNKIYKRSLFTDYDIKFPTMCFEDMAVANKVFAHANRIVVLDRPLYYYNQHPTSTLATMNADKINDFIRAIAMVRISLERNGLYEKYKKSYLALTRKTCGCCYMYVLKLHNEKKNMKGCIPDSEKRKFHTMGLHKPIAYLNKLIKHSLIIVDGMNGDLNFEEGGNPVQMNRIIAGKDPVLIDTYAAHLMGFSIEDVPYIAMAEGIGAGTTDLVNADIIELNKDNGSRKLKPSRRVQELSRLIVEDSACSACYGSLIYALERLDEKGLLNKLKGKLYIGQNYKNKQYDGLGIGVCTSGFDKCVKGCPPKARDIVEYLEGLI